MKKSKVASMGSDLPRTPIEAMASKKPIAENEAMEEEKLRNGEFDLEHLMKAHDIQNDPERMEFVHRAHAKKSTAMRSIEDLKMAGQALAAKKSEELKAKAAQPRHKSRYPAREK